MSILVVGVSHHTAPVSLLEELSVTSDGAVKLLDAVSRTEHVQEAAVLATCNRLEIYTDVDRFHGSVEAICQALCDLAGQPTETVVPHLYVHYDDGAVAHLFHVAAGLDSMVVGEGQILGQTRDALRRGQEAGTVGTALNSAFQQAIRVAKRTRAETDIDRAAPSLVSVSLRRAMEHVGELAGRRAVVIGAGSMASLAVATLTRIGVAQVVVAYRSEDRARRLTENYAVETVPASELAAVLPDADVVVSCTGAIGTVLTAEVVAASRADETRPLAVVDLAMPHDVDAAVADLPGVRLIDLQRLSEELTAADAETAVDVGGVRRIVAEEVQAFLAARRVASVTPTVVALRSMATGVVDVELARMRSRLPGLDPRVHAELELALRRVADKLMHRPTVRVKELADSEGAVSYAAALAELFALDPQAVEAVTSPEVGR